jgi:pimeloyl-ACP methyl ester carboxylesterase
VDGLKLHYLTAGHGPTVILLHGYTQTSRIWKPIIPLLAAKFTVIAPDLPGIGDSGIPTNGLDMKSAAISIRSLVFRFNGPTPEALVTRTRANLFRALLQ